MSKRLDKGIGFSKITSVKTIWCIVVIFLALFFNPLYLLFLLVCVERFVRLPLGVNYILALSISLLFINREIGGGWSAVAASNVASDDAVNYIRYYNALFDKDFYITHGISFYNGGEPLWYTVAAITRFLTGGNNLSIVMASVMIPILLLHKSLANISYDHLYNVAFFYLLFPEIFHVFYHLWRFALSLSITMLIFSHIIRRHDVNYKLIGVGLLAHVTSIITSSFLVIANKLSPDVLQGGLMQRFIVFFRLVVLLAISYLAFIFILEHSSYSKLIFYIKSEEITTLFAYNSRHYLYMIISAYLIMFSKRGLIISLATLNFALLLLPMFLRITVIYERVLLLLTPLIILTLLHHLSKRNQRKSLMLIPMFLLLINFVLNSNGQLFYEYMSRGHAFDLFNGAAFNVYSIMNS
jgi:hypothetical protein